MPKSLSTISTALTEVPVICTSSYSFASSGSSQSTVFTAYFPNSMHLANVTIFFSFFQSMTKANGIAKQPNIKLANPRPSPSELDEPELELLDLDQPPLPLLVYASFIVSRGRSNIFTWLKTDRSMSLLSKDRAHVARSVANIAKLADFTLITYNLIYI